MKRILSAGLSKALAISLSLVPAAAQFVDNGGSTAPAHTGTLGQDAPFEKVSTEFDGISFTLQRLILDPSKNAEFRLIATLTAAEGTDAEVAVLAPIPTLTDELGNACDMVSLTGVGGCRNGSNLSSNANFCRDKAVRVVPGVDMLLSIAFAPCSGAHEPSFAEIANTAEMRVQLFYTVANFTSGETTEAVIGGIPIPKP